MVTFMPDCIFCKIARGEIPSDTVWEDDTLKAFSDIHPKAPVHVVIIPRIHIESVAHLADAERGVAADLIYAAQRVAKKIGLKGYKLVFNVGREGGQVVDHLHLHLLGGWGKEGKKSLDV